MYFATPTLVLTARRGVLKLRKRDFDKFRLLKLNGTEMTHKTKQIKKPNNK